MVNFDLDYCLSIVPNRYELILFAKTRATEIFMGSDSLVKKYPNEKPFFSALREISSGCYQISELQERTIIDMKNSMFGIYADNIKSLSDKFDDNSVFAKVFIEDDSNATDENNIFEGNKDSMDSILIDDQFEDYEDIHFDETDEANILKLD